jgi:hypothetical protein
MLATTALAGAGFNQSPRLVNLAGLFQRASIVTGFGWLTALSAQALTRAPAAPAANRQPESATPLSTAHVTRQMSMSGRVMSVSVASSGATGFQWPWQDIRGSLY